MTLIMTADLASYMSDGRQKEQIPNPGATDPQVFRAHELSVLSRFESRDCCIADQRRPVDL